VIVRVGSASRMKIGAARAAFRRYWPKARVSGAETPSGVAPQPLSIGEIARGARNRARAAFVGCDFSVGIEAGVFRLAGLSPRPLQITLAIVFDGRREGVGSGPFFELPERLLREIVSADAGSAALVTKGRMSRGEVTRDAVLAALAPFVSAELYER
jgi:inosine/xanthosine triphosphatase